MTITAEVKGCTISLRQPPLAGGTVGDVTVEFHFDEVWNGYTRTAVFRAHGKTVLMLLASDRCTLPPEATAGGDVLLGVFGVCGEKTLTTPFCRLAVAQGVPTAACCLRAADRRNGRGSGRRHRRRDRDRGGKRPALCVHPAARRER